MLDMEHIYDKKIIEHTVNSPYLFEYNKLYNIKIDGVEFNNKDDALLCTNLVIECGGNVVYNIPFSLYTKLSKTENNLYFPVPDNMFAEIPISQLKYHQVFLTLRSGSANYIPYKLHYTIITACDNFYCNRLVEEYYSIPLKSTNTINIPYFGTNKKLCGFYIESSKPIESLTVNIGNGSYVKKYDNSMLDNEIIQSNNDGYLYYLSIENIQDQVRFTQLSCQDNLSIFKNVTVEFNVNTVGMVYSTYCNDFFLCNDMGALRWSNIGSLKR